MRSDLHLHEQLLLLVLRDRKGTVDYRAGHYNLAMGGAILAELAIRGCVRIDEGKKAWVEPVSGAHRVGNEILDEALARVRESKRRRLAAAWVTNFGSLKHLRHRTAVGLGPLHAEHHGCAQDPFRAQGTRSAQGAAQGNHGRKALRDAPLQICPARGARGGGGSSGRGGGDAGGGDAGGGCCGGGVVQLSAGED